MTRLRITRALAALAVAALVLAGCGGGAEGKVRLRMIESLTSPERTRLITGLLDKFEEQNPDIEVELVSPPLEGADQKITQILQTRKGLDVLEVRDLTVKSFSNNGWLLDLTPAAQKWPHWDQLTDLTREKATEIDGKAYLIPYGFYQKTLFYRTDRLQEAGRAQPPQTWQELYEAGVRLTDPDQRRYGYSFRGGDGANDYAVLMISAYLGEQVDPAKSFFLKDGRTIFSTPEAAQAMELFIKLFQDASPPDSLSWSYPEMVQGFTSGVTSLLIQDPEVIKTVEESGLEEGTWSTVPIPKGPSGYALQPVGYAGWGVTSFTQHKDAATKLVQFLSSPQQSLEFAKGNSLIPIDASAAEDPQFSQGAWKAYLDAQQDPKQVITVRPAAYPGWNEWNLQADKDVQALLSGDRSIAEVLGSWDTFWADQATKVTG